MSNTNSPHHTKQFPVLVTAAERIWLYAEISCSYYGTTRRIGGTEQ